MRVRRVDASLLERFERTPSGGLRVPATPARVGVQVYKQLDGSDRREYRPADEVFSAKSLATYRGATVTDLHPSSAVTPENYRRLAVGHVGDTVGHNDTHVTAEIVLNDADMIRKVEQGFARELSCGYTCDFDPTPGVSPEGEPYDGVQRRIEINHVAVGPMGWARAGESASLRLDAADVLFEQPAAPASPKEPRVLVKIVLDGKEYEKGSDEHFAAIEAKAAKQLADEKARADAAEQRARELPKRIERRAALRSMLQRAKDAILGRGGRFDAALPSENPDEPETPDVIKTALAQLVPDFKPLKDDPLYLEGALMMAVHALKSEPDADDALDEYDADPDMPGASGPSVPPGEPGRQDGRRSRRDDGEPDAFTARQRMIQSTEQAWKRAGKVA